MTAISTAKQNFFDKKKVVDAIGKARAEILKKQGALVRQIARRSMRKRKTASKPGDPPSVHSGKLKNFLWFRYDPETDGVIIGPEKFGRDPYKVPSVLEHGGKTNQKKNPRRKNRKVGDGGIVAISGTSRSTITGRFQKTATGRTATVIIDNKGKKRRVAFARLATERMVAHAEKLEEIIYGPKMIPASNIAARPFMGPALDKSVSKFPDMWRNTIR